ncbi:T9SS type A sorting domain-containing protein [Adhaeribacter soli]|uniref:T9SS type A sorting domain-containing protein n=1 Tax=Adhaeribacter soli TaxID=2607655 RepID=A0A5N1J0Z5_9BACT|nr:T9SS type A sorting domain-containing protein [Adhaeribacter soli]KAA9340320.1 T9SS type A sorting domain-containing protein [Adhaeribacter soli]
MKRRFVLSRSAIAACIAALCQLGTSGKAQAQVSINQLGSYTQNFNSLQNTGTGTWTDNVTLPGWYAANGTTAATAYVASNGSSTTTGLKSYGSAGSTDRALGCVNAASGTHYYGVRLKNNTGSTISRFIISYTAELWAKPSGNKNATVKFHYQVGGTSLNAGNWTEQTVDQLTFKTGGGGASTLNGNLANYRSTITFSTPALNLAPGAEIMFRWADATSNGIYVGLDDITITPTNSNLYYSKSSGALTTLSSWGPNTDGSGTSPSAFSNGTFIIANRTTSTLTADWTVASTAKVLLGEGTFTVPSAYKLVGTIDVAANTTLTLANTVLPTLGNLADNSKIIYNSSSTQALPGGDYSILTISGTGTKQLSANTRIKKSLEFTGAKLELGNYDLELFPDALISGVSTSSYIVTNGSGSLEQEVANDAVDVIFPVGTSAYMPVRIRQSSAGTTDNFRVKAIDGVYPSYINNQPHGKPFQEKAVNLTWIVDEEVTGGSDVTLTMEWDGSKSLSNFDASKTQISHFYNGSWDDATPVSANNLTGRYSLSRSGITSFSPFGVFSGSPGTLPVELVSFQALRTDKGVSCTWATATEKDNSHFSVERSLTGKEFSPIGTVKGTGNSSQTVSYTFQDEQVPASLVYYRLRQTDFDGTESFSKVVAVRKAESNNLLKAALYPNPAGGIRYLKAELAEATPAEITVTDAQGKVILQARAGAEMLKYGFPLNLAGQPKGVYFISVRTDKEVSTLRALQH